MKENKFYPCLWCGTTEKSIQTFFCSKHEGELSSDIKKQYVELALTGMDKLYEYKQQIAMAILKGKEQSNERTNKGK